MSGEGWRLIEDGLCDGVLNMATDHAILQACCDGEAPPTLRLYGWACPALTVGYSQNVARDVDLSRCKDLGVSLVRRPTGGRAILHHIELTYCVVAPIDHPMFPPNLKGTYRVIAEALQMGLRELGIHDGILATSQKGLPSQGHSPSCFSSLNHCEIAVRGRKLIGSAQRRMSKAFLQHGSIIIKNDHALLNSLLRFSDKPQQMLNMQYLQDHTISLDELLPGISFEEVRSCFGNGFRRSLMEGMSRGGLSTKELSLCDRFSGLILI